MNEQMQPAVTGPVEPPVMQHTPGPWHTNGYSSPITGAITVYHRPFGLGDVAEVYDIADA